MKILNYILFAPIFIMVAFSLIVIFKEIKEFTNSNSEIYWIKQIATIDQLNLVEYKGDDVNFPYDVFPLLKCQIEYSYTIQNIKYSGNSLGSNLQNRDDVELHKGIYKKLLNKNKIYIWVNPNQPNESSLTERKLVSDELIFGIGFLIFPLFLISAFIIRKKHPTSELANQLEIYNDR